MHSETELVHLGRNDDQGRGEPRGAAPKWYGALEVFDDAQNQIQLEGGWHDPVRSLRQGVPYLEAGIQAYQGNWTPALWEALSWVAAPLGGRVIKKLVKKSRKVKPTPKAAPRADDVPAGREVDPHVNPRRTASPMEEPRQKPPDKILPVPAPTPSIPHAPKGRGSDPEVSQHRTGTSTAKPRQKPPDNDAPTGPRFYGTSSGQAVDTAVLPKDLGLAREMYVAEVTGGRVPHVPKIKTRKGVRKITYSDVDISTSIGGARPDVFGPNGELIAVGGPKKADKLDKMRTQLHKLKRAADQRQVRALAYFEEGTPEKALNEARRILGAENVHSFPKVRNVVR